MKRNKTLKICFISPKVYPLFDTRVKSGYGGAEVQLTLLGNELKEHRDLDIHFMVADYGQKDVVEINGIKLWKSLRFQDPTLKRIISFLRVFRKINADVYIQRTLTPFSGLMAIYCKLTKRKFVYMVAHDGETDGNHEIFRSQIGKILAGLNFRQSSLVIVQNTYEFDNLRRSYKRISLEIIRKSVDLGKCSENLQKLYDCAWIGRCEKWKNPGTFLDLAQQNPNLQFLMICAEATGKRSYFQEIRSKARAIDNIEFLDKVSNEEVFGYLSRSRMFCITSDQEGDWPMTVLEAMSCRLPILSLNLDYGGLLTEHQGGFHCENNPEMLSTFMCRLLEDDVLYRKMSDNAYEYVERNHGIERNTQRINEIIRGLE